MATKKISELEAITEADGSDVLAIVDVSEGKTNKITKNNLLKGSGHTIEMSLNENYQIVLKLKNAEGTELSTATIDLPNENAITNISYSNGTLTLTKQSGVTSTVDISGLINGLATETALTNLANALKETIGIDTTTYNESQTYNTGDIVVQNEKIYKANQDNITGTFDSSKWDEISLYEYQKLQDEQTAENYKVITKLQEDVEDLTERVEDAENNQLTNTPEVATSHYLQDSADSRFRKFIPIGRTTQESTTGKNLAGLIDGTYSNNNVTVIVNNGKVTINGTPSSNTFFNIATNLNLISGDYVLYAFNSSTIGNSSASGDYADIRLTNTTGGTYGNYVLLGTKNNKIVISLSNDDSSAKIVLRLGANLQFNNFVITPMLIKGTSTAEPYEPYTGGEPAPNPNYPMAIKNTGDIINIFDGEMQLGTLNNSGQPANNNSCIRSKNFTEVKPSTDYTINNDLNCSLFILFYDKNKTYLSIDNTQNVPKTFTTPENAKYIKIRTRETEGITDTNIKIKLEQVYGSVNEKVNNSDGTQEQNLSFPLAQGQKLMQGDYLADDGIHHKMGEVVLDGTEDWQQNSTYNNVYVLENFLEDASTKEPREMLSTHFIYGGLITQGSSSVQIGKFYQWTTIPKILILGYNSTSLNDFKTFLAQQYANGTPVKVQYELAEEQTEDFTEEQKTAYPEWKKARTYKNVTHISSEDETPANVELEYVVDINTIDDRITALEAKVNLLEE